MNGLAVARHGAARRGTPIPPAAAPLHWAARWLAPIRWGMQPTLRETEPDANEAAATVPLLEAYTTTPTNNGPSARQ